MFHFCTPWKRKKLLVFYVFQGLWKLDIDLKRFNVTKISQKCQNCKMGLLFLLRLVTRLFELIRVAASVIMLPSCHHHFKHSHTLPCYAHATCKSFISNFWKSQIDDYHYNFRTVCNSRQEQNVKILKRRKVWKNEKFIIKSNLL